MPTARTMNPFTRRSDPVEAGPGVVVGEHGGAAAAPPAPDLHAYPGIGFEVADVAGAAPVLGDDPERVAVEAVADGVLAWPARFGGRWSRADVGGRDEPEREQPTDGRVQDVLLEGRTDAGFGRRHHHIEPARSNVCKWSAGAHLTVDGGFADRRRRAGACDGANLGFGYAGPPRRRHDPHAEEATEAIIEGDVAVPAAAPAQAALRNRDFRIFWGGTFASNIGTWMQNVLLGAFGYELTGSATSSASCSSPSSGRCCSCRPSAACSPTSSTAASS